jgi:hypothetical protein
MRSYENRKFGVVDYLSLYYGGLQTLHLVVLAFGLFQFLRSGTIGFPAPPPPSGWSRQASAFLMGNGAMDAVIALLGLAYLYSFLAGREGSRKLGLISVTGAICSAIFFGFGTIFSGAWETHPGNYAALVVVFLPVFALFYVLVRTSQVEFNSEV